MTRSDAPLMMVTSPNTSGGRRPRGARLIGLVLFVTAWQHAVSPVALAAQVGAGLVALLAVDSHNPNTLYVGTGCSGILKSLDGGASWSTVNGGLLDASIAVSALRVDPSESEKVYAATYYDALYKTTDGGDNWSVTGLRLDLVTDIAVDPTAPATLYAGAGSGGVGQSGVFKSTDGGATWRSLFPSDTSLYVRALAIDPTESSRIYAAGYGDGSVFRSTDGGETWIAVLIETDVRALVLDPASPGTLYAAASQGVLKSTDAGFSWNTAGRGLNATVSALTIDPAAPTTLYAATFDAGAFKSTNGGVMWRTVNAGLAAGNIYALALAPSAPTTLYVGGSTGLFKSTNGAATWRATNLAGSVLCGDGIFISCSESCDDGNAVDGDGCDSNCTTTACGNHIVTSSEDCDDGNRVNGDGCDANCTLTTCSNGITTAGEECDDGNRVEDDGCDHNCTLTRCGNGVLNRGEECDHGNVAPFDGCTIVCTLCGNGVVTPPEQCDDGNTNSSDGCTKACTMCGDGVVTAPEGCDDGNLVDRDGCSADCVRPGCGNAVSEGDEECDDGSICIGSINAGTPCTDAAQYPAGACNTFGGDGCAANCTLESDVTFTFVPGVLEGTDIVAGTSGAILHGDILTIPIPIEGRGVLKIGKQRDGQIPAVAKAGAIGISRTPISTLACECPRPIAAKTCGGTFFEPDGRTLSADCTPGYTAGDRVCAARKPCAFLHGPGNSTSGVIGCAGLDGVNARVFQDSGGACGKPGCGTPPPPMITQCRRGGPGSAALLNSGAIGVTIGQCTGSTPENYGPDGEFCTDDDPQSVRGVVLTNPLVTGRATATVVRANDLEGNTIGPYSVTGAPFDCDALTGAVPSAAGAALVSAFVQLDRPTVGDSAFTTVLVVPGTPQPAQVIPLVGDCNGSDEVTIEEIIAMVNIALGRSQVAICAPGDANRDGEVTVDEIIRAVSDALAGCV